jgi:hypothetical protein
MGAGRGCGVRGMGAGRESFGQREPSIRPGPCGRMNCTAGVCHTKKQGHAYRLRNPPPIS